MPAAVSAPSSAPSTRLTIGMIPDDFTDTNRMREVWNGVREAVRARAAKIGMR